MNKLNSGPGLNALEQGGLTPSRSMNNAPGLLSKQQVALQSLKSHEILTEEENGEVNELTD